MARSKTTYRFSWTKGKTKTIRVPIALAEDLLAIARVLDEGKDTALERFVRRLREYNKPV